LAFRWIVLVITVFILVRRKRHLRTPEARYQRDIRETQMSTYLQTNPRSARQSGADGLENNYGGYSGLGG